MIPGAVEVIVANRWQELFGLAKSCKKVVDQGGQSVNAALIYAPLSGAIAQLGERNTGSVEVGGSIPPGSTKQLEKVSVPFI